MGSSGIGRKADQQIQREEERIGLYSGYSLQIFHKRRGKSKAESPPENESADFSIQKNI